MTQPTVKPAVQASVKQGKSAPSINNNDFESQSRAASMLICDSQSSTLPILDKAGLIALFTIPDTVDSAHHSLSHHPLFAHTSFVSDSSEMSVEHLRVLHYQWQNERTRQLYLASVHTRPTYLVQLLKRQFIEYQQYELAQQLDKRGLIDTEALARLWQQLHVVDDIITDIVQHMPAQQPAGWQITVQEGHNPLCLPTVGTLKHPKPILDQASLTSYVLGHFGVSSFTYDRGYYIGHVIGYLFSCYFCAHLSIIYSVTALGQDVIIDYDYASLETPHMVRLLQGLDGYCKKRIYQLAVICARLSVYASDKRIEKMLITEVNDFDKKLQQQHLDVLLLQGMMPESSDSTPLF